MKTFVLSRDYLLVTTTGVLSGLIVFCGQIFANLGLSLFEITIFAYSFIALTLLPFALYRPEFKIKPSALGIFLLYGLVDSVIALAQFAAVILGAPIAIAVLLLYTQPLWTILFSSLVLKERVTRNNAIACALVLLGILFLANPFTIDGTSIHWPGVIAALVGGIGLSGWVVVGSAASKQGHHPMSTMYYGNVFLVLALMAVFPIARLLTNDSSLIGFSFHLPWQYFLYLFVFGSVTQALNHLCYLKGAKRVPTVDAGIILLLEPITGAILAALFLHQPLTPLTVLGGILILTANYLVLVQPEVKGQPV